MKALKATMLAGKSYWIIVILLWICAGTFYLTYGLDNSYLLLTAFHTPSLDTFFSWVTNLGDGLFAIAIALLCLCIKKRKLAVHIVFSFLLTGLFVQIGKHITALPRPSAYFTEIKQIPIHTIEATNWGNTSFPSGHTATTFALLAMLLFHSPKSKWNIVWISLAYMVGYSRIYVASHFLRDVLAGALLGIICAMACYILLQRLFERKASLV